MHVAEKKHSPSHCYRLEGGFNRVKTNQEYRLYIGESLGPQKNRRRSSQPALEEEQMRCSGPFVFCAFLQSIITPYGPL